MVILKTDMRKENSSHGIVEKVDVTVVFFRFDCQLRCSVDC